MSEAQSTIDCLQRRLEAAEAQYAALLKAVADGQALQRPSITVEGPGVAALLAPIDMVLHCPACGVQHIDAAEPIRMAPPEAPDMSALGSSIRGELNPSRWKNPPHRSHLCHGCGHIWRPADVPTNGVAAVKTQGKNDSPLVGRAAA